MKANGKRRFWSWALAVPLAGFLLYWSLRGVDWKTVWSTIAGAHWQYVVAAALFVCLALFMRSLRWRILLNAEEHLPVGGVSAPPRPAIWATPSCRRAPANWCGRW